MIYSREINLIGENSFNKIRKSKIIIFGVGGVGGYIVEFLARAGVGHISIVDYDIIEETNINRQIIALRNNIGKYKVQEIEERIKLIDDKIEVYSYQEKLTDNNIDNFDLNHYDFVIDAIDDYKAKTALIKYCYQNNLNIVSSLGVGNKISVPNYVVEDISKTSYDNIAKKLRKYCKENCIKKLDVVYSNAQTLKTENNIVGSISYHPPACASVLVGFVINKILKENLK